MLRSFQTILRIYILVFFILIGMAFLGIESIAGKATTELAASMLLPFFYLAIIEYFFKGKFL